MTTNNRQPKILIVGTQPYNKTVQSRAFDSYFKQFDHINLAQIFSDSRIPCKGHCSKLFRITDKELIKKIFCKKTKVGHLFLREELKDSWEGEELKTKYRPKHKGPLYRLIRKAIWNKKKWDTPELEDFVKTFKPDYIFVAFSKDFFIFDIAIYFSELYQIPLILSIADDYVFYDEYKGKPFNRIYRKKYLSVMDKIMAKGNLCIFESEAIRNKYLDYYKNVTGKVIYIGSDITPTECKGFAKDKNWFYFGNLEYGRIDSLIDIGNVLNKQKKNIVIHVYTKDNVASKKMPNNVVVHKQIPYSRLLQLIKEEAGMLLIVEGFKSKDVEMTRYSLSTKVGDSLCSGIPILAYGSKETGAMSFLIENGIKTVSTTKDELQKTISMMFDGKINGNDLNMQYIVGKELFSVERQSKAFLDYIVQNFKNANQCK